jgi:hypothetical protein
MPYESMDAWLSRNDIDQYLKKRELIDVDVRNRLLLNSMKMLHGKNWLLFGYTNKEVDLLNDLDSLGYKKIDEFKTVGSSAYLYDFGE